MLLIQKKISKFDKHLANSIKNVPSSVKMYKFRQNVAESVKMLLIPLKCC